MGPTVSTRTVREGSTAAAGLEELYVRNAPAALRLAYFLTGDRDLAEDLVQDAFVRLAGRFRHLRRPDAFDRYLRRTIVNLFNSYLRRLRLERSELALERSEERTHAIHDDPGRDDALWCALRSLPQRQRTAVVLRFYEDLSERDIADLMRCSTGAVNQLVARAMTTLRADLKGEDR
jgi:RNA polymerase sigma-70 factor (sigma-E family)